jgi:hypothetical protein
MNVIPGGIGCYVQHSSLWFIHDRSLRNRSSTERKRWRPIFSKPLNPIIGRLTNRSFDSTMTQGTRMIEVEES